MMDTLADLKARYASMLEGSPTMIDIKCVVELINAVHACPPSFDRDKLQDALVSMWSDLHGRAVCEELDSAS